MDEVICLDEKFSTTKMLIQEKPILENKTTDQFDSVLFLPENSGRKGEGGLRTKGYYKSSYEKLMFNDECLILKDKDGNEFKVDNSKLKIKNSSLNKLPLISIITVVFNGEEHLEQTIQSVITQSYDNVEYIIIDGGSTDGTLEIIKKYEDQIDYWVSEKDAGIFDAMNKGIKLAQGELVGLINADDYYSSNIFQSIVESYMKTNVNVIYGDLNYIGENSHNVIVAHETGRRYGLFPNSLKWIWVKMLFGHPTAFITRRTYKKYGLYNTVFKISGDYELFIRLYKHKVKFYNLKKTIANFRIGGISTCASDKLLLQENEVARRLHGRIPAMLVNNFLKIKRIVKGHE